MELTERQAVVRARNYLNERYGWKPEKEKLVHLSDAEDVYWVIFQEKDRNFSVAVPLNGDDPYDDTDRPVVFSEEELVTGDTFHGTEAHITEEEEKLYYGG